MNIYLGVDFVAGLVLETFRIVIAVVVGKVKIIFLDLENKIKIFNFRLKLFKKQK